MSLDGLINEFEFRSPPEPETLEELCLV